ncbi:Hypothetical protein LUCI_2811 [Lucifera butyrica]|uniref:EamA domain-containing protein n=1 Tax=Lucifera butyrica TaxID=1351585 RepID=A0A498R9B9_9FIRM|nr:DMT family transporter [Lucifera butyrica]VBB07547.1 Hypothetical protein LUCI_2811 [Lucifera butyrica]
MKQQHAGSLLAAASAAGFATLAIFIKFAYEAGANLITILSFRFLLAGIFLYGVLKLRGISLQVTRPMALSLFLMGALGYGSMSVLFGAALQYLPASLTALLLYTYPALVTLLSFAVGDETCSWQKGLSLTGCFCGLFLVLGVSVAGINGIGVALSLGAAVIYSVYIVISNRLLKDVNSMVVTTYVCLSAALVFWTAGLSTNSLTLVLSPLGWLSILGTAIFATLIGVLFFFAGVSRIGATNASIISTLEPVITVILSVVLLGDSITPAQAGGGLLILVSILLLQLWANNSRTGLSRR